MPDRAVDGSVKPLFRINRRYPLRYCPQASSLFYHIQYDLIIQQDYVNYCPQDNNGFYDFLVPPD